MTRALTAALCLALGACADWDSLVAGDVDAADARDLAAGPDLAPPSDLTPPPDLLDSCTSGVQDGDETDVDCGGSCAPCDVGRACAADTDCQTANCDNKLCELASAPPSWTTLPPPASGPPTPRIGLGVTAVNGVIVAIGGATSSNGSSNILEVYDPDTKLWVTGSGTSVWRAWHAVTSTADYVVAIGGYNGGNTAAGIERAAVMPPGGFLNTGINFGSVGSAATPVLGTVFVLGGTYVDPAASVATVHNTVQSFVPTNTAFDASVPPAMATTRSYLAAATGSDGRIYAIGGSDGTRALANAEAWTPSPPAAAWSGIATMRRNRELLAAVSAPDGRIYAIGGGDRQAGSLHRDVEAYSASHNRWVATASMAQTRWAHGAAVGADGRIYVVGGSNLNGFLTSVEAYGPIVSASVGSAASGDVIAVSGNNFARNATVTVRFASPSGSVAATLVSDAGGAFGPANVTVPVLAKGATRIHAIDDHSRYPVSTALTIK